MKKNHYVSTGAMVLSTLAFLFFLGGSGWSGILYFLAWQKAGFDVANVSFLPFLANALSFLFAAFGFFATLSGRIEKEKAVAFGGALFLCLSLALPNGYACYEAVMTMIKDGTTVRIDDLFLLFFPAVSAIALIVAVILGYAKQRKSMGAIVVSIGSIALCLAAAFFCAVIYFIAPEGGHGLEEILDYFVKMTPSLIEFGLQAVGGMFLSIAVLKYSFGHKQK